MLKEGGERETGNFMKYASAQSQNLYPEFAGDEKMVKTVGNK